MTRQARGNEPSLIDNEPQQATVQAEIQTDALALYRVKFARLKTVMVSRVMNTVEQRGFCCEPQADGSVFLRQCLNSLGRNCRS